MYYCNMHNKSCALNLIYNIRAISHLLQEITRQGKGEGGRKKSPTQHVKTCVRFHHRQGHPLLVLPQCPGLVTRSHAGWRQTCSCYRRGAHLADYVCKNFTLLFFSALFFFTPNLQFTCTGIWGVEHNFVQLWTPWEHFTHTCGYKHQKEEKERKILF